MATIHVVKIGLLEIDVRDNAGNLSFGMTDTGVQMEVPAEWEGSFYPSYIPEGYSLSYIDRYGAVHVDSEGRELTFGEKNPTARFTFDTEGGNITNVLINGSEAIVIEKEGWTTVVWSANNHLFYVVTQAPMHTALQVAASVTLIK